MHTLPYPVSPTGKEAAGLLPLPEGGHTITNTVIYTTEISLAKLVPSPANARRTGKGLGRWCTSTI